MKATCFGFLCKSIYNLQYFQIRDLVYIDYFSKLGHEIQNLILL